MKKSELQQIIREEVFKTLNESPDVYYDDKSKHTWREEDAVTFGYFNGVLYTSLEPDEMWQRVKTPWAHADLGDWIANQIDEEKIPEPVNWDYDHPYIGRDDFEFPGRLWPSQKIISFWDYPKSAHELKTIIQDINKKVKNKFQITDDWRIDLGFEDVTEKGSQITPISSYKSSKEAKPADKGQAHIAFGKHGNVPSGVGSKFKFKNQQPGETVAQMRARLKTSESKIAESNTMKKSELQKIIREEIENVLKEGMRPRAVKDVHLETRKTKSQTSKEYPFFLIKDYMEKGYWDKVNKNDFKKAFEDVISFLLRAESNTLRLSKQYDWMIDFDELWQYQLNKED